MKSLSEENQNSEHDLKNTSGTLSVQVQNRSSPKKLSPIATLK